jgi:CheY-specific phosphatase CheX
MSVRFFGQFLLENGVINSQQLLAAITYQDKMNLKFGETAIRLDLLDKARLEKILALQRKQDIKTGEAAVKLGFLTASQVDQILRAQKNSHVMIGEALVKSGALTEAELSEQLQAFKKDQETYQICNGLPRQKDPTGLAAPAVDLIMKFLGRLANLQVKLLDIRYTLPTTEGGTVHTVRLPFAGDHEGEIALRASEHVCAQIASAMLGEPITPDARAIVLDATREFLNVVGGNLAAFAARQGRRVDLAPPCSGDVPTDGRQLVVARIGTPNGDIDLIVATTV